MAYTLDSVDLGEIQSEMVKKSSGVVVLPILNEDSDQAEVIPTTGAQKVISISGKYTGDITTLQTFINHLNEWIRQAGDITASTLTYNSDLNGSMSVRVNNGSWNWNAGSPLIIDYNLTLIEGKDIYS